MSLAWTRARAPRASVWQQRSESSGPPLVMLIGPCGMANECGRGLLVESAPRTSNIERDRLRDVPDCQRRAGAQERRTTGRDDEMRYTFSFGRQLQLRLRAHTHRRATWHTGVYYMFSLAYQPLLLYNIYIHSRDDKEQRDCSAPHCHCSWASGRRRE